MIGHKVSFEISSPAMKAEQYTMKEAVGICSKLEASALLEVMCVFFSQLVSQSLCVLGGFVGFPDNSGSHRHTGGSIRPQCE